MSRIHNVFRRSLTSTTFENTLWLGSSHAVNGIVGALTTAVLARALGVADYGVYALIVSLMIMMIDVADLGLSSSIVRFGSESISKGDAGRLRSVIAIVIRWKLIAGFVLLALAVLFAITIGASAFSHIHEKILTYFWISFVAVALGIAASIFTPIYQSFQQYKKYSLLLSARSLLKLILIAACVFILLELRIEALVLIEVCVIGLSLILLYALSPYKKLSPAHYDRGLAREMFSFNKWISVYQLIVLVGGRLDMAFVGGFADQAALGLYGAGSKVAALINAVASSYMSVLMSDMSLSPSHDVLRKKQKNAFAVVMLIAGGIVLIAALANPIITVLFGSAFAGASVVLQIMCVGVIFTVLSYPFSATLFALNMSAVFPIISAVSILVLTIANIILIPKYGATGAALAFAINGCVAFSLSAMMYLVKVRPFGASAR